MPSLPTACAATPAHTVQHEPRELLPAICDPAIERRIQQGSAVAAHIHEPEPSPAAANWTRRGAQV
jgi:hypothetical protein